MAACEGAEERCQLCSRLDADRCHCHPFNDEVFLEATQQLLNDCIAEAVDEGHKRLDHILKSSKMKCDPHQANRSEDRTHVEFKADNTVDRAFFNGLVRDELKLRMEDRDRVGALMLGSLEDRVRKLKEMMTNEAELTLARNAMSLHESIVSVTTRLTAKEAIPCVLHVEIGMSEKLFWGLPLLAFDRCIDGDSATRKLLVERVTECMRGTILGGNASDRIT